MRFEADAAELDGDEMQVRGELYAAGKHVPLEVEATVSAVGEEFEIEASAVVDHRGSGCASARWGWWATTPGWSSAGA